MQPSSHKKVTFFLKAHANVDRHQRNASQALDQAISAWMFENAELFYTHSENGAIVEAYMSQIAKTGVNTSGLLERVQRITDNTRSEIIASMPEPRPASDGNDAPAEVSSASVLPGLGKVGLFLQHVKDTIDSQDAKVQASKPVLRERAYSL